MAERNDLDHDAIAHVSNAGNRNRTLEKTGYNLRYNNQPEWIQRQLDKGRAKEWAYTSFGAVKVIGPIAVQEMRDECYEPEKAMKNFLCSG